MKKVLLIIMILTLCLVVLCLFACAGKDTGARKNSFMFLKYPNLVTYRYSVQNTDIEIKVSQNKDNNGYHYFVLESNILLYQASNNRGLISIVEEYSIDAYHLIVLQIVGADDSGKELTDVITFTNGSLDACRTYREGRYRLISDPDRDDRMDMVSYGYLNNFFLDHEDYTPLVHRCHYFTNGRFVDIPSKYHDAYEEEIEYHVDIVERTDDNAAVWDNVSSAAFYLYMIHEEERAQQIIASNWEFMTQETEIITLPSSIETYTNEMRKRVENDLSGL